MFVVHALACRRTKSYPAPKVLPIARFISGRNSLQQKPVIREPVNTKSRRAGTVITSLLDKISNRGVAVAIGITKVMDGASEEILEFLFAGCDLFFGFGYWNLR